MWCRHKAGLKGIYEPLTRTKPEAEPKPETNDDMISVTCGLCAPHSLYTLPSSAHRLLCSLSLPLLPLALSLCLCCQACSHIHTATGTHTMPHSAAAILLTWRHLNKKCCLLSGAPHMTHFQAVTGRQFNSAKSLLNSFLTLLLYFCFILREFIKPDLNTLNIDSGLLKI